MNTHSYQLGPVASTMSTILLFTMLLAGLVLGGFLFVVLALSSMTMRVLRRLSPVRGTSGSSRPNAGEIIEGSYVVLDEAPRHPSKPSAA